MPTGGLAPGQRWSVGRKREVVLRLLRGEAAESLSRELGVPLYRLEAWRERALSGIDGSVREREGDAVSEELAAAMKRIGELTMENEVLRARVGHVGAFGSAEVAVMAAAIAFTPAEPTAWHALCDSFGVARSSFYAWRRQQESTDPPQTRLRRGATGDRGRRGAERHPRRSRPLALDW